MWLPLHGQDISRGSLASAIIGASQCTVDHEVCAGRAIDSRRLGVGRLSLNNSNNRICLNIRGCGVSDLWLLIEKLVNHVITHTVMLHDTDGNSSAQNPGIEAGPPHREVASGLSESSPGQKGSASPTSMSISMIAQQMSFWRSAKLPLNREGLASGVRASVGDDTCVEIDDSSQCS